MPKRRRIPDEVAKPALEILREEGIEPFSELVRELRSEIRVSEQDLAHPAVASRLAGGWEAHPSAVHGGFIVRPSLKVRVGILQELCSFVAPRLRSSEVKQQVDTNIVIEIQKFPERPLRMADVMGPAVDLPDRRGTRPTLPTAQVEAKLVTPEGSGADGV